MSRRGPNTNSRSRLERRAEREARELPANSAPRARRVRTAPVAVKASTGRFGSLPIAPIIVAVIVVAGLAYLASIVIAANKGTDTGPTAWQKAELNSDPKIPGTYIPPHPGQDGVLCTVATCVATMDDRLHVAPVIPICDQKALDAKNYTNPLCYQSNPPTSGPHNANPMPFKVLDNPAPKESLVHNMEHGGVVVWYNTDDQAVIKQLADAVNSELGRRKLVVMSKYTEMEANTIAITSWTRLDKFPTSDMDKKRVTDFIEENSKRFNPEGF